MKKIFLPAALLMAIFTTETVSGQTQQEKRPAPPEKEATQKPAQSKSEAIKSTNKTAPLADPSKKTSEAPTETPGTIKTAQPQENSGQKAHPVQRDENNKPTHRAQPAQRAQPENKKQTPSEVKPNEAPSSRNAETAPAKKEEAAPVKKTERKADSVQPR
jgi:translation initiation factor IF-2